MLKIVLFIWSNVDDFGVRRYCQYALQHSLPVGRVHCHLEGVPEMLELDAVHHAIFLSIKTSAASLHCASKTGSASVSQLRMMAKASRMACGVAARAPAM